MHSQEGSGQGECDELERVAKPSHSSLNRVTFVMMPQLAQVDLAHGERHHTSWSRESLTERQAGIPCALSQMVTAAPPVGRRVFARVKSA